MDYRYERHRYPSLMLISDYAYDTNMDVNRYIDYENKYYRYKNIENKYLNGFTLTQREFEDHLSIGRELEHLLEEIINK